MSERGTTRRGFLGSSAGMVAGLTLLGTHFKAQGEQLSVRVRRNLGTLDLNQPADRQVLDQYTEGVRILRQRSAANSADPRGWTVQAGLHTYRCQHGNWWFFPWHRAYLYEFERLIQDAIGDPTFALPYWDWTDSNQLTLPAPFRDPSSPLYDANRRAEINAGTSQLDWSYYDTYFGGILNFVLTRSSFLPSFGSSEAASSPGLERSHGAEYPHGDVEGGPHDTVHVWVAGGGQSDMGNPVYAALDPIFWVHHCNLDRLWSRWRAADLANHLNPASATWLNQQLELLRPDGQAELIGVAQLLSTWNAPLNYHYDDETAPPPALAMAPALAVPGEAPMMMAPPPAASLAVAEPRFEVRQQPLTVSLKLAPPAHAAVMRALTAPIARAPEARSRVLLIVEGISFEDRASGVVEVYLNAPQVEQGAQPPKGHAVGTFSFFAGHPPAPAGGAHAAAAPVGTAPRFSRVFDITESVRALQAAGTWNPNEIQVSLVRRPFDRAQPAGKVTFSRAMLRVSPTP